jgi:hypothetical protein
MSSEGTYARKVTASGVDFEWTIEGPVMHGKMSARTLGWVTVGFNQRSELKGTRLIMGYVQDGKVVVEEHIADPPNHGPKSAVGGRNAVVSQSGTEQNGVTTIEFTLTLDTGDDLVPLEQGQVYFTTLAWSHEDDLYHHSAMRTAIDVKL